MTKRHVTVPVLPTTPEGNALVDGLLAGRTTMTDKRTNREHSLKCWPEPFAALRDGSKRHEYRLDDRGFAVGDVLVLHEWDPTPQPLSGRYVGYQKPEHTLRARVTYVGRGFGIPDGYVCMSVEVER